MLWATLRPPIHKIFISFTGKMSTIVYILCVYKLYFNTITIYIVKIYKKYNIVERKWATKRHSWERERALTSHTTYSLLLQVLEYLPPLSLSRLLLTATRCSSSYDLVHTHHMYGTVLFGGHSVVILQPTKNHSTFILYCTVLYSTVLSKQLRTTSQTRFYHSTILFSVLLYTIGVCLSKAYIIVD